MENVKTSSNEQIAKKALEIHNSGTKILEALHEIEIARSKVKHDIKVFQKKGELDSPQSKVAHTVLNDLNQKRRKAIENYLSYCAHALKLLR